MDGQKLHLLMSDILKRQRFTRALETKLTSRELDVGKRALRDALKAARRERARLGAKSFYEEICKPAGRMRIARGMVSENTLITPNHASRLLEQFDTFNHVLDGQPVPMEKPHVCTNASGLSFINNFVGCSAPGLSPSPALLLKTR